tara:strand:- start:3443 stop:4477 length:1035 start_codon:yes stop_codon:yes gene_type:complete
MKIFKCPNCFSAVFFENTHCVNCKSTLGYDIVSDSFIIPNDSSSNTKNSFKFCFNYQHGLCNWLIDENNESRFCKACELNRKVPSKGDVEGFKKWQKLEIAKHRLIYQLKKLNLPIISKLKNKKGIAFDFLSADNKEKVVTGHANGVITILLPEADSVYREQLRKKMEEPYRTLLGHFRHEIGHYYWMHLFNNHNVEEFRSLFGDERQNYGDALKKHYKFGAPSNWNLNFISKYASAHPSEDWAETWAHYLHLMDTLETANAMNISLPLSLMQNNQGKVMECPNPYQINDFKIIFNASMMLTSAVNSLNRSMGLPDIYPFIVPKPVYEKLQFIHYVITKNIKFI